MDFVIYDAFNRITRLHIDRITNFIFKHSVGFGDSKSSIRNAIEYSAKEVPGFGGQIFVALEDEKIIGAAIVNKTGMSSYMPENLLIHLATHKNWSQKQLRKTLIELAKNSCSGELALYVKPVSTKKFLYHVV